MLPKLSGPKTYYKTACLTAVFLVLMLVCNTVTFGQLTAAFTINKESGCKPLTVQFTNTTTGAGANVVYTWNFGNGNTSALTNPGATYIEEKTYTVTLTATSGGNTSTATKQITVYKTPTVDFAATPTKGCMPLAVGFTANATAGDGTISKYFWDFGDGETEEGPSLTTPKHTYTFAQQAPVSLTVTNSFGCFNTRTYGGMVDVYPEVMVDFEADKRILCKTGETVKFNNKATGGTLSKFEWDFGDGSTSTDKSPVHAYNKKGIFDVKLKVTNSAGCSSEKLFEKYIRVAEFGQKINYNKEGVKCTEGLTTFYSAYDGEGFDYNVRWYLNGQTQSTYQEHLLDFHHNEVGVFEIKAEFDFNGCKVDASTSIEVFPKPPLKGMVIERDGNCNAPFNFVFSDTTPGATKWDWTFWYISVPQEKRTLKSFAHTFPSENYTSPTVFLTVENEFGCKAQDTKNFSLTNTQVRVETTKTHYNDSFRCKERIYTFKGVIWTTLNDSFIIDSLQWDFGDTIIKGTNDPTYQMKNAEDKNIIFRYKTEKGCSGTVNYILKQFIVVDSIDFSIQPANQICGNNLFQLIPKGFSNDYESFFNDKWQRLPLVRDARGNTIPYFQFRDSGTFNIHMIFNRMSQGYCIDTVTKSIQIKPPFSGIGQVIQTCDGDRGLVKIVDTSKFASSWVWDFGDGTKKTYTTKPDTVEHHYTTSGNYKVYQRVKFENCEVLDSIEVKIFLKQKPIITISGDSVCHHVYSHPLRITLADSSSNTTNLARNFYTYYEILHYPGGYSRGGHGFTFGNGSLVEMFPDSAGFTSLRVKIGDYYCSDTSDLIQFKVKGPSAHFGVQEHWKCFNDTIQFLDASQGSLNVPIVKWEWDFGDGTKISKNTGGNFGYRYSTPGDFFPYLKITDADGCHDETPGYLFAGGDLWLVGPKAVIGASATVVALNTTVNFSNNSFGRYLWEDGNYTWYLPDGSIVNDFEPAGYLFNKEGEFEVKLVSSNPYHDCIDSTTLKITVRAVNAQFTHSISYVNNNGCPPAIVRFTSTATNAVRYGWNFGNGATGGNATTVTHTYNQPGIYQVWHYSYDVNNNVDSSFDFIEIKGPYAIITANRLSACNTLEVTLSADVKNADSFTWDLGDGTISSNPQAQITHQYLSAGIYTPSLILEDAEGCKATSILPEKIIVDSLNGSFTYSPEKICAGANVIFTAKPQSFSAEKLGKAITYEWKVADGNNTAPGQENKFNYIFNSQGTYGVTLTLESEYGCGKVISNTVNIQPPLNAAIQAASQICQRDTASFNATASGTGVQFRWYIPGQPLIATATTKAIAWNTPGTYTISLAADNGACIDSVIHVLTVNPIPAIGFNQSNPRICLGDTRTLSVAGNATYTWDANTSLRATGNGSAMVWPATDSWFALNARSDAGCTNRDSIKVTVVQPFTLAAKENYEVCLGESVSLSATGANRYQWIPAAGLSNAAIANPVANINSTTQYRVIGFDAAGCFTDTVNVQVTMHGLPQVNAGPDVSVLSGESVQLNATSTLQNVNWNWTPATYLNCTNCPNPVSKPNNDITYKVTAISEHGCSASDEVSIVLLCAEDRIYIPTGFTPNSNGLNERFGILGSGFSLIKSFRIFDRWGQLAFERTGTLPADPQSFWNGNYPGGKPAPSGTYQYVAEVACATGAVFSFKGSVTLIR